TLAASCTGRMRRLPRGGAEASTLRPSRRLPPTEWWSKKILTEETRRRSSCSFESTATPAPSSAEGSAEVAELSQPKSAALHPTRAPATSMHQREDRRPCHISSLSPSPDRGRISVL